MTDTTLPTHSDYLFASPRYNTIKTTDTLLIPNDFLNYDLLNGTYDKYFPCYAITDADAPKVILTKQNNSSVTINGDLSSFVLSTNRRGRRIGRKEKPNEFFANSNLEQKTVFYQEHVSTKLTPGWCNLQTSIFTNQETGKFDYIPNLLVRSLGNSLASKVNLSVNLDNVESFSVSTFPVGFIAEFKGNVWLCTKETTLLPPERLIEASESTLEHWKFLNGVNVFHVDMYLVGNGSSKYFMEIESPDRNFNPELENVDDTLVCWNVAYYHK